MDSWQIVFYSGLTSALVASLLNHWNNKKLEGIRAENVERHFRFSISFERTATVIETLYAKLVELKTAADTYTALAIQKDDPLKTVSAKAVSEKLMDVWNYFPPHRIYLPKETAIKVLDFINTTNKLRRTFAAAFALEHAIAVREDVMKRVYGELEEVRPQMPAVLHALEDDFQIILGLSKASKK